MCNQQLIFIIKSSVFYSVNKVEKTKILIIVVVMFDYLLPI